MSIVLMIILLSILILVHEAGHFVAARIFGIKVEKFGFGLPIGPTLYRKKVGDVEILVHAFLLGGYVSFADDDKDCDLPADSPERFANKPAWQKAVVVSAGVIANVLCALALVMFVALWTKELPSGNYEVYVKALSASEDSSARKAGLQIGDRILSVNGCDINNMYSFVTITQNSAKNNGTVTHKAVEENYKKLKELNPAFEKDEIIPKKVAIRLPEKPYRDMVTLDKYEAKGAKYYKVNGYKLDDTLKKLSPKIVGQTVYVSNGKYTIYNIAQVVSDGKHPMKLKVLRNGKVVKLNSMYPNKKGKLGIGLKSKQIMVKTDNIISATVESCKYLADNTCTMVYSLGQLFVGNIPVKDLHGVVAITKIGGDIINKAGKSAGILLAALISMNLAVLNILPIPVLDGGHLMFMLIEKITGKKLNEKVIEKISSIFFIILIILMVLIIFNDINMIMRK